MSAAFVFANEQDSSASSAIDPGFLGRDGWDGHRSLLPPPFAVVREMLSTLDQLTAAGQQYVMGKVVAFLRDQVARTCIDVNWRNQGRLPELLEDVTSESERRWPNPGAFSHRTENLVALLIAVA